MHGTSAASSSPSRVDVWLARGSNIAQVGILAITVATLFYTVIPLYKTAALEEQIARREAELAVAEKRLATLNLALRDANDNAYVRERSDYISALYRNVDVMCTGWRQRMERRTSRSQDGRREESQRLAIPTTECMAKADQATDGKTKLRDADRKLFEEWFQQAIVQLEQRRADALKLIDSMPTKSDAEVGEIAERGDFAVVDSLYETLSAVYPQYKEAAKKEARERQVNRAQLQVEGEFERGVPQMMRELQKLAWPEPKKNRS